MKRLISSVFITSCLWGIATLSQYQQPQPTAVQAARAKTLFFAVSSPQAPHQSKPAN
ncbi:MAG TPA: hypothetical protein V6D50_02845 [Chroococcales cyanobacterium]|jgi:hypothetical protein